MWRENGSNIMKCFNFLDLDEYAQNTWNDEYNQEMAAVHALFIYLT